MSAKSSMGEVNAVVRLAPALQLSSISHWVSIPKKLGVSGRLVRAGAAARSAESARPWAAPAVCCAGLIRAAAAAGSAELSQVSLGLWYALTLYIVSESRDAAQLAATAVTSHGKTAERIGEVDLARERELAFREIHARLLPIVDAVAAGATLSGAWTALAAREAARARRLVGDGRARPEPGLAELLSDVRDTFAEAGMAVSAVFRIVADPPAEIGEAVAYAVREALTNVLKHADPRCEVHLFAESAGEQLEVVVRDRGLGFDPDQAVPGCGFARTYGSVRRLGGAVDVQSSLGAGTKVRILWPAAGGELAS